MDLQLRPALAPGVRLQTDSVTGEPVLLYPEGLLELNTTAREIVALCDGTKSIEQIVAALVEEFEVPSEVLEADVPACLRDLQTRGLIALSP